MTMQRGAPLSWTKPVEPGNRERLGNHRGPNEALNVIGAVPGFHYYYEARKGSNVLRRVSQGYEVVTAEMPERFGAHLPDPVSKQLDGITAFSDVILMRIPIEKYKKIRAAQDQEARERFEASTSTYLDQGQDQTARLGHRAPKGGNDVYFKRPDHGVEIKDHD